MFYNVSFDTAKSGLFDFDKGINIFIEVKIPPEDFFVEKNALAVNWLAEDLGVSINEILCDLNEGFFGAGRILKVEKSRDSFFISADLPKSRFVAMESCSFCDGRGFVENKKSVCLECNGIGKVKKVCSRCQGNGYDDCYGEECISCHGKGFRMEVDWMEADKLLCNLQFLFRLLSAYLLKEKTNQINQIEYSPIIARRPYMVNIGAEIVGNSISKWLANVDVQLIEKIEDKMKETYEYVWGGDDFGSYEASVKPKEGAFYLSCPGDRCSLYGNLQFGINSHNIDNPAQVFTLFAGLTELEKLRSRE